ncbi:MAG: ketoacyl-ACP synthase III [Acidimicrobiia bacterium]|jgi:3-oxoacyl-[acyl-carrier-protein] synthase-3|nr:ketoacyl-ACP synthase III [Acidimicrobiia bacterium]MBP8179655.1 ketoacyl-ACP synthase III [Acidimicrobiia bacterium]
MSTFAYIRGTGAALPDGRITNAELAARFDVPESWILERTGIIERRRIAPGQTASELGAKAGEQAIQAAQLSAGQIDMVIVATGTPDQPQPATAAFVQHRLGLACGGFDISGACAGFVYAVSVAAALVRGMAHRNVLVIGVDVMSSIVDPQNRATAVIFGDGAGAVVVSAADSDEPIGVLSDSSALDGGAADILQVSAGGSTSPATPDTIRHGDHYLKMNGKAVLHRAVDALASSSRDALERCGLTPADVDWFVPHQSNVRIIFAAAEKLGVPFERFMVNIDRVGNMSAASVPVALDELVRRGDLDTGDLVVLSGYGAGMTQAAVAIRWLRAPVSEVNNV